MTKTFTIISEDDAPFLYITWSKYIFFIYTIKAKRRSNAGNKTCAKGTSFYEIYRFSLVIIYYLIIS